MKKLLIIAALVLILGGCASRQAVNTDDLQTNVFNDPVIQNVSFDKAEDLINNNDIVVLDVRTPEERTDGCLKNSINIDYNSSDFQENISKLDKEKSYLVYCRSGNRSGKSSDIMEDLGFSSIYNLEEGFSGWTASGGEVSKSC